jgi:hypothetical protein
MSTYQMQIRRKSKDRKATNAAYTTVSRKSVLEIGSKGARNMLFASRKTLIDIFDLFPEREACLRHHVKCLTTSPDMTICLRSDDKCSILIYRYTGAGKSGPRC